MSAGDEWLQRSGHYTDGVHHPHDNGRLGRADRPTVTYTEAERDFFAHIFDRRRTPEVLRERRSPHSLDEIDRAHINDAYTIMDFGAFKDARGRQQSVPGGFDGITTRYDHNWEVGVIAARLAARLGQRIPRAGAAGIVHDCTHIVGAHGGEEAMTSLLQVLIELGEISPEYVVKRYGAVEWDHAQRLVMLEETLNVSPDVMAIGSAHSFDFPRLDIPEHALVSWGDRIGYSNSDLRDGMTIGSVRWSEIPVHLDQPIDLFKISAKALRQMERMPNGRYMLTNQLVAGYIDKVVETTRATGITGMDSETFAALSQQRQFAVDRTWGRPEHNRWENTIRKVIALMALNYYFQAKADGFPDPLAYTELCMVHMSDKQGFAEARNRLTGSVTPDLLQRSPTLSKVVRELGVDLDSQAEVDGVIRRLQHGPIAFAKPVREERRWTPVEQPAVFLLQRSVDTLLPSMPAVLPTPSGYKEVDITVSQAVTLMDQMHSTHPPSAFADAKGTTVPVPRREDPHADEFVSELMAAVGAAVHEGHLEKRRLLEQASSAGLTDGQRERLVGLNRLFAGAVGWVAREDGYRQTLDRQPGVHTGRYDLDALATVRAFADGVSRAKPAVRPEGRSRAGVSLGLGFAS